MPTGQTSSSVIRIVEGRSSKVAMQLELKLRFDYGMSVPWVTRLEDNSGLSAVLGPNKVILRTPRRHGVLLLLAPLASFSLAGQKHGRIIPSVDMKWVES